MQTHACSSDADVRATLRVLDELGYVFETLALDHRGECKGHLADVCRWLEQELGFRIAEHDVLLAKVRTLRGTMDNVEPGHVDAYSERSALASLMRDLWRKVHADGALADARA